jgi:hypothetical protein
MQGSKQLSASELLNHHRHFNAFARGIAEMFAAFRD